MARTDFVERSPLTRAALAFADERHAGQTRDVDGLPFVTHPVEVACLLHEAGYSDEVVAAGVLHDVLEDTDAERHDLEARFGRDVADLVDAVSDDPSIEDGSERKAALRLQVARAGERAAAVFAADKVSKARELRVRASRGRRQQGDDDKIAHYEASLEMLAELIPEHELVRQLRSELSGAPRSCRSRASRPRVPAYPAASSRAPSRRASPSPPQRITSVVVVLEHRPGDRPEHVHPALRARHLPVVQHGGHAVLLEQPPAAAALEIARRLALHEAPALEPQHGEVEHERVRDAAAPGDPVAAPHAPLVTAVELAHADDSAPPLGPVQRVLEHLPDVVARALDQPAREEPVARQPLRP